MKSKDGVRARSSVQKLGSRGGASRGDKRLGPCAWSELRLCAVLDTKERGVRSAVSTAAPEPARNSLPGGILSLATVGVWGCQFLIMGAVLCPGACVASTDWMPVAPSRHCHKSPEGQ